MKLLKPEFTKLYKEVSDMIEMYSPLFEVDPKHVRSRRKTPNIAKVRKAIAQLLRNSFVERSGLIERRSEKCNEDTGWVPLSFPNIGKCLNLTHGSVIQMCKEKDSKGD